MTEDDWFERALKEDEEELFEEDFASAFEATGISDGPQTGSPETETDFESPPDSDLSRLDLGIEGLDAMIQGGIPTKSLLAVIGSAGTGKTTVGLQFLAAGLAADERAIFITLEQDRETILDTATEFGWPFSEYADSGALAVVDLDPVELAHSLDTIRSELPRLVREHGASRLVLDSVSLLEMMYDNPARRRNELYDFARSLKSAGVTALLTSEASESNAYSSRYGTVEYLTDGVVVLQYIRTAEYQATRLGIEIQKLRNTNHSRELKPYEIDEDGISVYQQANIF
jgi:KaiC domain protein